MSFTLYRMNKKKQALKHLSIARTILSEFEKDTEYRHPLLKDVEDRISSFDQNK